MEDNENVGHWRIKKGWVLVDEERVGHCRIKKGWGIGG